MNLSVVIPLLHDAAHLELLLPELHRVLESLGIRYEILPEHDASYGSALLAGFTRARGEYILTMDADVSHSPNFIRDLWVKRHEADMVIASRYAPGGTAMIPRARYWPSRVLNRFFQLGLNVPVRDLSSGFRLYKASLVRDHAWTSRDFDILQEILVRTYSEGWTISEIPFAYAPRSHGSSYVRAMRLGGAYLRTFWSLWKLRNSILAADYDDRAHDSRIPLQRYWQRSRYRHVTELIAGEGPVLDVGCGSSRIIGALPAGSVAIDILLRKLRYARKFGRQLVHASGFALPFPDESFPCVLSSQVIEHVPKESPILDELVRVLQPGGRLVLGTPDYDRWEWVWMERAYGLASPGGYADEHIAHYTFKELIDTFTRRGFTHEATRYICRGELILALRKSR